MELVSVEDGAAEVPRSWRYVLRRKVPIITWLPQYTLQDALHDLLAGFTVALTEIPQSIAYAKIAGLPLQYGLYSSFMGGFMYAIFGSCRAINMGSTSIMSLLIHAHVAKMGLDMSTLMSFLGGAIILLFGLLRLGFVVDFFSYPVMAGFTSAAAVTIASTQIGNVLGLSVTASEFISAWESVIDQIKQTRRWDLTMGIVSLAVLIVLKEVGVFGSLAVEEKWSKSRVFWKRCLFFTSVGKNAIVIVLATVTAYILEQNDMHVLKLTDDVAAGLPPIQLPPFSTTVNGTHYTFVDMMQQYGVSIIFIPLIAIIESVAIAKVFSGGRALDASQEMIALGIANLVGSFFLSMPVTGSFTRTAVNNASGARTNLAAVFTGSAVILALCFLTSTFRYIPKASLAAVIICAMIYLFDYDAFVVLWRNKKLDLVPFLVTLLSSVFLSLEYGILIGIATNLLFILYSVARPKLDITVEKISDSAPVYLITPRSTIHFPAAEYFREAVLECKGDGALIVVNGRLIGNIDITVAKIFGVLAEEVRGRGQTIVFLNFKSAVERVCTGLYEELVDYFRIGELHDLIQDRPSEDIVPKISESYPVE